MPYRPLALVCVLAGGDYLLWNWSLQGNHDVLSLVSGLTLPPLAIALAWLLALNATRLLARIARARARASAPRQQNPRSRRATERTSQQLAAQQTSHQGGDLQHGDSASSKLAA